MGNELATTNEKSLAPMTPKASNSLTIFSSAESFQLAMKMAETLAKSTIVPKAYQGNPGNCLIAIEMASRIDTSPMMVMQNLYIVNGNPSWSSQWIIAMINNSGRFRTELQFDFGYAPEDGGLSCIAWALDKGGRKVTGPKITMQMAKDEGWYGKSGSKWKTMPEVMIRYRAASFFGRVNCPDLVMGIYSQDEVYDMGEEATEVPAVMITNPDTGEIITLTDEVKEDPEITQEQRHMLFRTARQNLGADADSVLKDILNSRGLESTAGMKTSKYREVMSDLMNVIDTVNRESEAADYAEHNEEPPTEE